MNPAPSKSVSLSTALLLVAVAAVAFRAWTSLCFVPFTEWNDVRLAPTFMLAHGVNPYPGLDTGPLTTWTYGPVTLLLNLPAILAGTAEGAILIGGVITLLCAVLPLALAVHRRDDGATTADRGWALLLCLALWPNSSLHYIQSDNAAVAFGLVSCWLLGSAASRTGWHLAAALCAALAVWSKQTTLFLVPAQIVWLFVTGGMKPALRYTLACAVFGLGLAGIFIAWFGFDGLWVNLVELPRRFPLTVDKLERTRVLWMALAGYVALPVVGVALGWRAIFRRDSPWLLPVLVWLFLLPTALLSTYGHGGSSNSLNNVLYLFPAAALGTVAWLRRRAERAAGGRAGCPQPAASAAGSGIETAGEAVENPARRAGNNPPYHAPHLWLTAAVVAIALQQMSFAPLLPVTPLTGRLALAGDLARQHAGRIYFPWNPLVTFYAERRFYHTEDGLTVRKVSGAARPRETLFRDLPPEWSLTAIPGWRDYYGEYRQLQPPDAQLLYVGPWSLYSWKKAEAPAKGAAAGGK